MLMSIRVPTWSGEMAEARRRIEEVESDAIDLHRYFVPVATLRAELHVLEKHLPQARAAYEEARKVAKARVTDAPDDAAFHSALGIALAGLGRKADAIREGKLAVELLPISKDAWVGSLRATDLAHIYAMVGEHELAIDQIEHLLSIPGEMGRASLAVDPRWVPLRGNPRFIALQR